MRWLVTTLAAAGLLLLGPSLATQAQTSHALRMTRDVAEGLIAAWNDRLPYVPGDMLVKFRPGMGLADRTRALSVMRPASVPPETRWIGDTLLLRSTGEPDAEAFAGVLRSQPEVEWAQPNYWRPVQVVPNDPSYTRQWNFDLIEMPRAWDINPGSTGSVTVAVVDSGITTTSETFAFPLWTGTRVDSVAVPFRINPDIAAARILPGRDFAFWAGPVLDLVGHGTHVAGTILQETNNNLGLAGIAYRAKLLPLKVCIGYWELQILRSTFGIPGFVDPREGGGCPDDATAEAIRYAADNGAGVINVSLGGADPSPVLLGALRYATAKGAFVAIAAGNEFEDGNPASYPAAYATQVDGVVSVGAVGRSRRRAFYSNTGAYVELAAPGGDQRDGGLAGVVYQASLFESDFDPFTIIRPRFDRYAEVPSQGTSMASPHVAGVAALVLSQGIRSPAAIEAALKLTARDLGATGRDDEFGFGLVNPSGALRGLGLAR